MHERTSSTESVKSRISWKIWARFIRGYLDYFWTCLFINKWNHTEMKLKNSSRWRDCQDDLWKLSFLLICARDFWKLRSFKLKRDVEHSGHLVRHVSSVDIEHMSSKIENDPLILALFLFCFELHLFDGVVSTGELGTSALDVGCFSAELAVFRFQVGNLVCSLAVWLAFFLEFLSKSLE